jgi:WD40 repeat protein/serine/threonine protein kinase
MAKTDKLEAIFHGARALPTAEQREIYLREACQDDAALYAQVRSLLQASEQADRLFPRGTSDDALPTILDPVVREAPGTTIGRYKLLQKIGEGGMGIVYMAEQEEPVRRRVALKIIKLGMDTRQVVARFEAERQALALMDHPNIARVLDGGATETGRPYFVMELVQGVPITEFCDKNKLKAQERLKLFIQVCQAIQSAHQKGIIHRDIKPSNVLVTLHHGEPMPKVIDFGIAKATNQKLTEKTLFTNYATMIGTPAYMSPEQAEMSSMDVDTRTDVYALGVLLYELLTGTTPFPEKRLRSLGYGEMQRVIVEEEPERPSTRLSTMAHEQKTVVAKNHGEELSVLSNLLKGDLDWVVMRCLEKDRRRRYETANELVADLQRHLSNEAVLARPPSAAYRLQKFIRRNKLAFTAASAVVAALLIGLIVSAWLAFRATRAEQEARTAQRNERQLRQEAEAARNQANNARNNEAQQRQRAEAEELAARRMAYDSDMSLAQQALAAKNLGHVQRLLDRHRPKPGEEDLRNWEWRYLWQNVQSDASFVLRREPGRVFGLTFSPDGKLLASGGAYEVTAKIWDIAKRQVIQEIPNSKYIRRAFAFSPRGDLFAAAYSEDQTNAFVGPCQTNVFVGLWDARTWRQVDRLPQKKWGAQFVTFSPDGRLLATRAYEDVNVIVWDVDARIERVTFETEIYNGDWGGVIAFSPDSKLVIAGGAKGKIRVFDLTVAKPKFDLSDGEGNGQKVLALAVSPDGKVLASATGYGPAPIKLWDLENGALLTNLTGSAACVFWLAFSPPDGRTLASCSGEHTIRLWDVAARRQIAELRGHSDEVYGIAYSPDGKTLASGGRDGSIQFWDAAPKESVRSFVPLREKWAFEFTLDGRYASRTTNDTIVFHDVATDAELEKVTCTNLDLFAFSPTRHLLVKTLNQPSSFQVHDMKTHQLVTVVATGEPDLGVFLTTGQACATVHYQTNACLLKLWDTSLWRERYSVKLPEGRFPGALSSDGSMVACGHGGGYVDVFQIPSGKMLASFRAHSEPLDAFAFSPDGSLLATGCEKAEAKIWDTKTWQKKHDLRGHLLVVFAVAFSPDGRRLATSSTGKEAVKLWDVETGQELATLEGQDAFCWRVMFSADGRSILAGPNLWRAPTWPEIEAAERVGRERGVAWLR